MRKAKAIVQSIFNSDKPVQKENLHDCAYCWCDSCAHLEACQMRRACAHNVTKNQHPLPCIGCTEGRQFMPKDTRRCRRYEERAPLPEQQGKI